MTKTYAYDSRNRLTETTTSGADIEPNISTTAYGYEENVQVHDGRDIVTEAVIYKETVKDTEETVISITYTDALGNVVKEVSGNVFTDYRYDYDTL